MSTPSSNNFDITTAAMTSDTVLVTGFGPFGDHSVNASWEAVKLLAKYKFNDVQVIIREIPVLYKYIDEEIPQLWKVYKPKLVVHVGVSHDAAELNIETQAFRTGYVKADCTNNKLPTGENCTAQNGKDCIQAALDLERICEEVNATTKIKAKLSGSAGRYLCEFVYYKSLNIDKNRTMFIHVPPLGKPYSAEELAEGIAQVIKCALEQLQDCSCSEINFI